MTFLEFLTEQPKDLAQYNNLDKQGTAMKLRDAYKEKDIGGKSKVTVQTTVVKDSKTGKIYSRKSVHQK